MREKNQVIPKCAEGGGESGTVFGIKIESELCPKMVKRVRLNAILEREKIV
jgi:hypothetical protein